MNIETKWLEDFLSLTNTLNFSRSAQNRHLTQPAFSRRIKALEDALGVQLIDRSTNPIGLTEQGKIFELTATNILSQFKECKAYLQSIDKNEPAIIDIALSHTLSLSLFPQLSNYIQQSVGDVQIRQLVANVDETIQSLKNGRCDYLLAFKDTALQTTEFTSMELHKGYLIPVCSPDSAGNALYNLDSQRRQSFPYLSYSEDIYLGRCVNSLLASSDTIHVFRKIFESTMAPSLKLMALQGKGIAWVPSFTVKEELSMGLLCICGNASWQLPLAVCLYRRDSLMSDANETLWRNLRKQNIAI